MAHRLFVLSKGPAKTYDVEQTLIVGRDENVQIRIPDESVAPQHAEIAIHGQTIIVRPLGPETRVLVNGEATDSRTLENNDVLQVGSAQLLYQLLPENAAPTIHRDFHRIFRPVTQFSGAAFAGFKWLVRVAKLELRMEWIEEKRLEKAYVAFGKAQYEAGNGREVHAGSFTKIEAFSARLAALNTLPDTVLNKTLKKPFNARDLRTSLDDAYAELGKAISSSFAGAHHPEPKVREAENTLAASQAARAREGNWKTHWREIVPLAIIYVVCGLLWTVFFAANAAERADDLAAHPEDPLKPAGIVGVSDAELEKDDALEKAALACIEAVEAQPNDPRQRFQLGRVLLLGGMEDDARQNLLVAAEQGHGGAMAYLGRMEEDGNAAAEWFNKAKAAGFKPADEMLRLLLESAKPDFSSHLFFNPDLLQALYDHDVAFFEKDRQGIFYKIVTMMGVFNHNVPSLVDPAVVPKVLNRGGQDILGGGSLEQQGFKVLEMFAQQLKNPDQLMGNILESGVHQQRAERDAVRILETYGDGAVTRRIYEGMVKFLESAPQGNK